MCVVHVCTLCTLVYVDERRCTSVCNLGALWPKKGFKHA